MRLALMRLRRQYAASRERALLGSDKTQFPPCLHGEPDGGRYSNLYVTVAP